MNLLTRVLKTGVTPGKDVEGFTRGMLRYLNDGKNWLAFYASLPVVRRRWGPAKVELAKRCAAKAGLPQYGVGGPALETALRDAHAFDLIANRLMVEYANSLKPKLVEPKQGFQSLDRSLWQAYTLGRNAGLTDLGTYNPASTLPSGRPSDHSVYPAVAFDLGFTSDTSAIAYAFFRSMIGRPEVEYVIYKNLIWSESKGVRSYTAGGHETHVHVSGHR